MNFNALGTYGSFKENLRAGNGLALMTQESKRSKCLAVLVTWCLKYKKEALV